MKLLQRRHSLGGLLAAGVLAAALFEAARADDPPAPDFFWPYGRAQIDGQNISPPSQTVLAYVNGRQCGQATTLIAPPADGTPPGDVNRTVYVIDVLADGSSAGQRPGCGHAGDPVTLYFAGSRRVAIQQPLFKQGGERWDVDLGPELSFHVTGAMLAGDGSN
jgi:hypothetical protein